MNIKVQGRTAKEIVEEIIVAVVPSSQDGNIVKKSIWNRLSSEGTIEGVQMSLGEAFAFSEWVLKFVLIGPWWWTEMLRKRNVRIGYAKDEIFIWGEG